MTRSHLSLCFVSTLAAVALGSCSVREPGPAPVAVDLPAESVALEDATVAVGSASDRERMSPKSISAAPRPEPLAASAPAPLVVVSGQSLDTLTMGGGGPGPAATQPVVPDGGYRDYGVNGFTTAADDHLSTFAIDVDTASYTMTRKNLRGGYLPPAGAVRVEEFVNYFPYEYDRPAPGQAFTVDFEATPSPWDEQLTLLRVGVQGRHVTYRERQPVHLTFLVDTSGSMRSEDKIELVKKSLEMLSRELEDGDTVAIATYAGSTKVVLEPTPISQRDKIIGSLRRLDASGSTAMESGIQLAYDLADRTFKPGSVNRVILCSDGDANVGKTDPDSLARQIEAYAAKGITLTTLGFGNGNYQDVVMERLANQGDGNYFYIDTELEARRVLVDKLTGTLEVIAKDVKIQVDFDPDVVERYRLVGYENRDVADRDFRNDAVDAGEIGAGHQVTALYELDLRDGADGEIATVRVRHEAPGPDAPAAETSFTLTSAAIKPEFAEGSDTFRIAAAAGYFAEVLRGSPHVQEISLSQVAELAVRAKRVEYPEDAELVELIRMAARLRGEGAVATR